MCVMLSTYRDKADFVTDKSYTFGTRYGEREVEENEIEEQTRR